MVVLVCSLISFQDSQPTKVRNPAPDETTVATPPHKVNELICKKCLKLFGDILIVGIFYINNLLKKELVFL